MLEQTFLCEHIKSDFSEFMPSQFCILQNGKNFIFTNAKTPAHSFQISQYLLKRLVIILLLFLQSHNLYLLMCLAHVQYHLAFFTQTVGGHLLMT